MYVAHPLSGSLLPLTRASEVEALTGISPVPFLCAASWNIVVWGRGKGSCEEEEETSWTFY